MLRRARRAAKENNFEFSQLHIQNYCMCGMCSYFPSRCNYLCARNLSHLRLSYFQLQQITLPDEATLSFSPCLALPLPSAALPAHSFHSRLPRSLSLSLASLLLNWQHTFPLNLLAGSWLGWRWGTKKKMPLCHRMGNG